MGESDQEHMGIFVLTQIDNDLKDLHPEILYPERERYTWKHVHYDMDAEFEDCLKF